MGPPIKFLLDQGYAGTIVITGSNLIDLRAGVDRMPGRSGEGEDLYLLPMDFFEFCDAHKNAKWTMGTKTQMLERYMRIGGFPLALIEAGPDKTTTLKTEKIIEKWILGDIAKLQKNENYVKDIMAQIAQTLCSHLSTQKLAQRTQIGSHNTVSEYLNLLEDMFISRTLFSVDIDTGAYRFKKEKKYYFTDPIFIKISLNWLGLDRNECSESLIAEMIAHEFLKRKTQRLGFLSSAKSGEVDFYAYKKWALEVKWSEDANNLSKAYINLNSVPKKVWFKTNFFDLEGFNF